VSYAIWASTFDMEAVKEMPSRSTVYDIDGKIYSRLQGENRIVVPLSKVSKHFVDALLAREDARFYTHRGVDPIGVVRAMIRNIAAGSSRQGASTLTQQLARNSFPERIGQKKSAHRKLLEAFVASRIEQRYEKDEILEHYLNRIYFGAGVYGIEAASQVYFGKTAENLSLGEAAMIAGVIRAPSYSSPLQHPDRALKARDVVLARMVDAEKITAEQAEAAKKAKLTVARKRRLQAQVNYAMDAVDRDLNILLTDAQRAEGGLKVYTTIDPALQTRAEQVVDEQLKKVESRSGYGHPKKSAFSDEQRDEEAGTPYLQGSVVVIDNKSGGIRALVGGRDYAESKYNRALMAQRQVGSTFKPFVYAAAYSRGMLPGSGVDDGPISEGEIQGASNWTPENSDGTYKGVLAAEQGLIQSRTTMSLRLGEPAGFGDSARVAGAVGIREMPQQPAVYLGAFESTLAAITSAYTVFPNNGLRRQSYIIERIDDAAGDVIYRAAHVEAPVLDPGVSWAVNSALTKVMQKGTGASARSLGWTRPAAGKTGTTNDYRDAWFIGYTSSLTCGVWVGLDKPQRIAAKGYGSTLALPIWVGVMSDAGPKRYPTAAFKPAVPLVEVTVCGRSNEIATSACDRAGAAYTAQLPRSMVPKDSCTVHRGGIFADDDIRRRRDRGRSTVPDNVLRSFRRFFGGQ
jgi:penicillin-binding protein 1A